MDFLQMGTMNETSSDIDFVISREMVARFSALTGDLNSLHTNEQFARKTIYRDKVVQGMLPLFMLPLLDFLHVKDHICIPVEIDGQFMEPVHENRRMRLRGELRDVRKDEATVSVSYQIIDVGSDVTATKGKATFHYRQTRLAGEEGISPSSHDDFGCMVIDPLEENDLAIESITKGDRDDFRFLITNRMVREAVQLLELGRPVGPGRNISSTNIEHAFHIPHLLAASLLSTSIGMCRPGKHATFLDYNVRFTGILEPDRPYEFTGEVSHVSKATRIIKKNVTISKEDKNGILASGKVNALVNPRPSAMPTMKFLRESTTDTGLREKIVLVTGASRGIGETIAKMFAAFGSFVAVNYYRGKDDAERIVDEIRSEGGRSISIQADVTDPDQVRRMVGRVIGEYDGVHILVNNAVRDFIPLKFLELSWDEVQKDIDVAVRGTFQCCQEIIPVMIRQGGGKIINISTVATDIPPPEQLKYVVAKSAVVGLTRSLAAEFAPKNIQVNMIVPGFVETDLVSHIPEVFRKKIAEETPMRRLATPIDVAHAAIFLASSYSAYTTGQRLLVTGGTPPYL